ncbi:MAG: DUF72 domain-containing protein [Firmicutes bacterium]|nr:DUF72 domain-containing protein [Bacillota bacterium]
MGEIRVGTCAWSDYMGFYPPHLPPQQRLSYYARHFSVVEIDNAFYAMPTVQRMEKWAQQTPDHFCFDVKAPATMTLHDRGNPERVERAGIFSTFVEALSPLHRSGKLGVILLQFPPWFASDAGSWRYLERAVARLQPYTVAVEFRERSWFEDVQRTEETLAHLREIGAVHVIADEPQIGRYCIPAVWAVTHPQFAVLRMHGRNQKMWHGPHKSSRERFDYHYTLDELAGLLPNVQRIAGRVEALHLLMNNNAQDYAWRNALDWKKLLGETTMFHTAEQPTLF